VEYYTGERRLFFSFGDKKPQQINDRAFSISMAGNL
jgi:hypothetical protein